MSYVPPYTISSKILSLVSDIVELISDIKHTSQALNTPILRKKNRAKSISSSLQIEGNTFTEDKVTAMIEGKRVLGTYKEIAEVECAINAYDHLEHYTYTKLDDLLLAHKLMMDDLLKHAGNFRTSNVGVGGKEGVVHVAPPYERVPSLMNELFEWMKHTNEHLLIVSCIFHYEFEFIHPFIDGNGRIGRLWQTVILKAYKDFFTYIPIESVVREHQQQYYEAIESSSSMGESTPFIEFMLKVILQTLKKYQQESSAINSEQSSVKTDELILIHIDTNPSITIKQLADKLNLTTRAIEKNIKKLKDKGILTRIGPNKGGLWKINE
jgi:Fic family protein